MLGQRPQRWPNIEILWDQRLLFYGEKRSVVRPKGHKNKLYYIDKMSINFIYTNIGF